MNVTVVMLYYVMCNQWVVDYAFVQIERPLIFKKKILTLLWPSPDTRYIFAKCLMLMDIQNSRHISHAKLKSRNPLTTTNMVNRLARRRMSEPLHIRRMRDTLCFITFVDFHSVSSYVFVCSWYCTLLCCLV